VTEKEVMLNYSISGRQLSLDAPFNEGEENSLLDTIAGSENSPESRLLFDSLQNEIGRVLATLTARESDVISHYYGLGGTGNLTLEEIGTKFHISTERVRQIREKATRRLRHSSRSKTLRTYLG
jgi:RNA polymerase primary sigma factor